MPLSPALPGLHQAPFFAAVTAACSATSACIGLAIDQLAGQPQITPQQRAGVVMAGLAGGITLGAGLGTIVALRPRYGASAYLTLFVAGLASALAGPMLGASLGNTMATEDAFAIAFLGLAGPMWVAAVGGAVAGLGWVLWGAPGLD